MTQRKIKFRGLRKDNNEWAFGSLSVEYDGTCFISWWEGVLVDPEVNCVEPKQFSVEVLPETVGQYTGQKDIKGNDVYEGDFVRQGDLACPVTYENGAFHIMFNRNQGSSVAIQERLKKFEIIGNIHQNKELLKQ